MWQQIREQRGIASNLLFVTDDPVAMQFFFFMPISKSISKKKKLLLLSKPHIKRPDIDNLIKFYLDVSIGLFYKDDTQVYNVSATKLYSDKPKTEVVITIGEPNGSD